VFSIRNVNRNNWAARPAESGLPPLAGPAAEFFEFLATIFRLAVLT
jgi:hypothetical protein